MRRIGAIALWVLATLGSTALAWQAVDAVGVAASGDFDPTVVATIAPRTLDSTDGNSLQIPDGSQIPDGAQVPAPPTSDPTVSVQPPNTDPGSATTTVEPPAAGSPGTSQSNGTGGNPNISPTSSSSPADTTTPATSTTLNAPTTTTSTTLNPPTTTITTTTLAPPTTTQSPTITQTFFLTGGTITVEFSEASVIAVVTEPATGFSADVRQKSATEIDVRFNSPSHRSRLRAWWLLGPKSEIQD